jgi:hypothetical protein
LYELDDRFENGQFLYDETAAYTFDVPASIVEGGINIIQLALLIISGGLFVLLLIFLIMILLDKRKEKAIKATTPLRKAPRHS